MSKDFHQENQMLMKRVNMSRGKRLTGSRFIYQQTGRADYNKKVWVFILFTEL